VTRPRQHPDARCHADQGAVTSYEPWLVVVDAQRVFRDADSPWRAPRFDETLAPIRRLAAAHRPRVVFTRFIAPREPLGWWRRYYDEWPFALQEAEAPMYALVDELAEPSDPVIEATTFGKWTPELAALLGDHGRLVLAGVATECCVISTALAAADAGVPVTVVAEACAGASDESHAQALDVMRGYTPLIEVVTLDEAVAATARTAR
jgi:nicotinamidase-related amidase